MLLNLKGDVIQYPIYYLIQPTDSISDNSGQFVPVENLFAFSPKSNSFGVNLTRDNHRGYNMNIHVNPRKFLEAAAETATTASVLKNAILSLIY